MAKLCDGPPIPDMPSRSRRREGSRPGNRDCTRTGGTAGHPPSRCLAESSQGSLARLRGLRSLGVTWQTGHRAQTPTAVSVTLGCDRAPGVAILDTMRISARAEYAVLAATVLAQAWGQGPVPAEEIAAARGIPVGFLEGILTTLRKAGLLTSRRGSTGGFALARPPEQISVGDVIRAVEGPLVYVRDTRPSAKTYPGGPQALVGLWVALRASVRGVLDGTTLQDLADEVLPDEVRRLADNPDSWSEPS